MAIKLRDRIVEAIIDDVAAGEPVRRACAARGVDCRDFYRVLNRDDDVGQRYARAKQLGLDAIADEAIAIADESRIGVKTTKKGRKVETVTGDMVERARLQVETRKWFLAKLAPKKYGERTVIAGDADNPLVIEDHKAAVLRGLTPPATAERAGSADPGADGAPGGGAAL